MSFTILTVTTDTIASFTATYDDVNEVVNVTWGTADLDAATHAISIQWCYDDGMRVEVRSDC